MRLVEEGTFDQLIKAVFDGFGNGEVEELRRWKPKMLKRVDSAVGRTHRNPKLVPASDETRISVTVGGKLVNFKFAAGSAQKEMHIRTPVGKKAVVTASSASLAAGMIAAVTFSSGTETKMLFLSDRMELVHGALPLAGLLSIKVSLNRREIQECCSSGSSSDGNYSEDDEQFEEMEAPELLNSATSSHSDIVSHTESEKYWCNFAFLQCQLCAFPNDGISWSSEKGATTLQVL
jgi:hypothetical protein